MKHTIPPRGTEVTEADELARLVPAPNVPELSDDRHDALRRFLVNEIDASTKAPDPVRRRPRRLAVALSAGAVGIAAVFAATVFTLSHHGTTSIPNPGGKAYVANSAAQSDTGRVEPAPGAKAGAVLTQVAYVAASQQVQVPREDQFVYFKTVQISSGLVTVSPPGVLHDPKGRVVPIPPQNIDPESQREEWHAQEKAERRVDRSRLPRIDRPDPLYGWPTYCFGAIRDGGAISPIYGPKGPDSDPRWRSLWEPTYRRLDALPRDPAALQQELYRQCNNSGEADHDDAVFNFIGELLANGVMPPDVTAALYRAAAKIPGVMIVPDEVDAAGRHGLGVARDHAGVRTVWILDKRSVQFLGERDYLATDSPLGKAGTLMGGSAVLVRGAVDKVGDIPASPDGTPARGM